MVARAEVRRYVYSAGAGKPSPAEGRYPAKGCFNGCPVTREVLKHEGRWMVQWTTAHAKGCDAV